jgi:hypothetical protein
MKDNIYLGMGSLFIPIPSFIWRRLVAKTANDAEGNLNFMSADHHKVRDFVVTQIPQIDGPISTATIAENLDMRVEDAKRIIDELERGMTFLYRSRPEGVTWAYPVTVDSTPHRVTFNSGVQTFAA